MGVVSGQGEGSAIPKVQPCPGDVRAEMPSRQRGNEVIS